MNKERAKHILENERDNLFDEIEYYEIGGVNVAKETREYLQALDIAIDSLETRYQMNDKGEITPIDNEWHTEQPQEDRQYLVTYYQECDLLIMCKWKNKQWYDTKGIALDNDRVIAWKKVEPYERKE